MQPTLPPHLQRYVVDELGRASALIERVVHQTLTQLRQPRQKLPSLAEERAFGDVASILAQRRDALSRAFCEALAREVDLDLARQHEGYQPQGAVDEPSRLTLMDDVELAADVELARVIEQIRDVAEWEQRELQTFTSSIAGRDHVVPESNPLRGEIMARALWYAVDSLPMSRGQQVLVMHVGGEALASALKLHYAAASTRLESQGIEPSRYRTGVPPSVTATLRQVPVAATGRSAEAAGPSAAAAASPSGSGLDLSLETLPVPLADVAPPREGLAAGGGSAGAGPELAAARAAVERQVVQWVQRRFADVDSAAELPGELRLMLRKLREIVQRQALRDPTLLEDEGHPAWALLRRVHYQSLCLPDARDPQQMAYAAFASGVLEGSLGQGEPGPEALRRVVDKVDAFAQRQFNERVFEASADIDRLVEAERAAAFRPADSPAPDAWPSGVSPDEGAPALAWLREQQPGRWYRLHWQERWVPMQLLWRSPTDRHWLFVTGGGPARRESLALSSLLRLRASGLLQGIGEQATASASTSPVTRPGIA